MPQGGAGLVHTRPMSDVVIDLRLDRASSVPVFEQICQNLRRAVASEELRPGTRLPATRALAETLGVAVNTVAKAYRDLEAEGLLIGRGRQGTFVRDASGGAAQRAARTYAQAARALGLTLEQAQGALAAAW